MNKKFLERIKGELKKTKASLEALLSKFAKKDAHVKGDWETQFPNVGIESSEDALEDVAKKREEYERLLPVEWSLEKQLQKINLALKKLKKGKKGKYGICEKCGRPIPKQRLAVIPEARLCQNCKADKEQ